MGEEGVEDVALVEQLALDVIDGVEEFGIGFDEPSVDEADGTGDTDAGFVVAVHVGAHGEFGLVFFGVEEVEDLFGVGHGVVAAADGAADGAGFDGFAVDADEHFR